MDFLKIFNFYGLAFVVVLLIPHIVFIKTKAYDKKAFSNRAMLYIARIGRFCSIFLMFINIGVLEQGYPSSLMEQYWIISTIVMCVIYAVLWFFFFKTERKGFAYSIVFVTAAIIIQSGLLQVKVLLFTAGVIYLIGDLYLTKRYFISKE